MKRLLLLLFGIIVFLNYVVAGGIVTNTNQSAGWARMLVRDASTSIDAVYFNPAGLTKLNDGLHISFHNQSVMQDRTLTNSFAPLNQEEFKGKVQVPLFPDFYAAYKTGKMAFSLGFGAIGGGGSVTFDKGVPMIEMPVSTLVPMLTSAGVTGYSLNSKFEGSSAYFGIQGGISYAINDMISVFAGARYVWAQNAYTGELKNASVILADGSTQRADVFLNGLATDVSEGGDLIQPLIDAGVGSYTFAQAEGAGIISATQRAQMEGGLLSLGISQSDIDVMDIGSAQNKYYTKAAEMQGTAVVLGDQDADIKQKGNGVCPIIGVNLALMDDALNIGIKYEFQTNMELTNETPENKGFTVGIDPTTGARIEMYPDGEKSNADIPAMLSIGVRYEVIEGLRAQVGYHTYFDKQTGWEKTIAGTTYSTDDLIDKNFWELGFGVEYDISDNFLLSAGYLKAMTGVDQSLYNSDLFYSLHSNTVSFGGAYKINDMLSIQLGAYYANYSDVSIEYTDANTGLNYDQKYQRSSIGLGIGLDFTFGK